ncbi:hypothetical protein V1264_003085 [Littorina saxatilis]|uniref:P2X purinoreceptor 7 intracellular domain-containing protein n=1 Tax=Littorina saxatilis TaxID=31220 RepID=A0AAN9B3Z9_9CAEN
MSLLHRNGANGSLDEKRCELHNSSPRIPVSVSGYLLLRTCYRWCQQQYGRDIADENSRYRYTAYRMLAKFAWGWLGKDVRVTLPASAVRKIRETFPNATGNYTGYLEPEN